MPNKNDDAFKILSFMVYFIFPCIKAHLTSASRLCVHMVGSILHSIYILYSTTWRYSLILDIVLLRYTINVVFSWI